MGIRIYTVDAFTEKPFAGNPAAVCILHKPADEAWMQQVAKEMNLSETAFLYKQNDGFNLRWFTPAVEVELCGHATLASAHVLYETGLLKVPEQAKFYTRSGLLTAERKSDMIELNFPATPAEPATVQQGLLDAISVKPIYTGKTKYDVLLEVDSEEVIRNLMPDFTLLKSISVRGVIVTSRSFSSEYDFISRLFAPGAGIDEDPVTGSAHCCLGPFWGKKLNKSTLTGYQASERGGTVIVHLMDDRVRLAGRAITILRGDLLP